MGIIQILEQFGLSNKEIKVYLTLLESGSCSVRKLAEKSQVNRGTTYEILKSLKKIGLVSYYHKSTKQFFVAEDPIHLLDVLDEKVDNLEKVKSEINKVIPELKSLQAKADDKPVVKYYEGKAGIKTILLDVLETAEDDKEYVIFSSSTIRPYLYDIFPNFTKQRIKKGIKVKVIAIGHKGTKADLSEYKSLSDKEGSPTYILIYSGKVAMISVNDRGKPLGLIIEDQAIYQTKKQLFGYIWSSLS